MPVMPDTRIALSGLSSGGDTRSTSPLQTLGAMMQIKESQLQFEARRQENEARQRQLEDDAATRDALQQYERPEDAIDHLWKTGRAGPAATLTKDVLGARTQQWQEADTKLALTQRRLGHAAQMLDGVDGDGPYQTVRPQLVKLLEPEFGAEINDALPTQYDPARIKQLVQSGTTRAEQIQQQRDLVANHTRLYETGAESALELGKVMPELMGEPGPDGKPTLKPGIAKWSRAALQTQDDQRELLNRTLLTATNEDQYNNIVKEAYKNGYPQEVLNTTPPWINNQKEREARLTMAGLSIKERGALETGARRSADYEGRQLDIQEARELAEARRVKKDAQQGQLVTGRERDLEEDARQKEDDATETWLEKQFDENNLGSALGTPKVKDPQTGKMVADPAYNDLGGYERLAKARAEAPGSALATAANEYIQRRVTAEDKRRQRLQNVPPLAEAAKMAVAQKDRARYDKLDTVYSKITNKVGRLSDIVPWTAGGSSVLSETQRSELMDVLQKLKDPALAPADRRALEARRDALALRK